MVLLLLWSGERPGGLLTRIPCIIFSVEGNVPSKSNYRASHKQRASWKRVLDFQNELGKAAMVAGAKRHLGKGRVRVEIDAFNQVVDPDNLFKAILDGLKNVAFEDDSADYIRELVMRPVDDDGPARIVVCVEWPEASQGFENGAGELARRVVGVEPQKGNWRDLMEEE